MTIMKLNTGAYELESTDSNFNKKLFAKNELMQLIDLVEEVKYHASVHPDWVKSLRVDDIAQNPINYRDEQNPSWIWFQESFVSEKFQLKDHVMWTIQDFCEQNHAEIKQLLFRYHDLITQNDVKIDNDIEVENILTYIHAYYTLNSMIKNKQIEYNDECVSFMFMTDDAVTKLTIPHTIALFDSILLEQYFENEPKIYSIFNDAENFAVLYAQLTQIYGMLTQD